MLINIAKFAATQAHAGQVRKYTNEPYVNHPIRVAEWLANFNASEDIVAAAYCHDILEDCDVTFDALEMAVGSRVAGLVLEVTNATYPEGTPRIEKYWGNIGKLLSASAGAQTLKCADIFDNCKDVYELDPAYGARYIAEKFFLVRMFTRADDSVRRTVIDLLSSIFNNMDNEHRIYCLDYVHQLERCPDRYQEQFHRALSDAPSTNWYNVRIGDEYGVANTSV